MGSGICKCICNKYSELENDEEKLNIIPEGFITPRVAERGIRIINLKCSGKLCVKTDDPNCHGQFVVNPTDASGKYSSFYTYVAKVFNGIATYIYTYI